MKRVGISISALLLSALFGASTFGYAQKPQQDNQNKQKDQNKQQDRGRQQQAAPQQRQQNQNKQQQAQQQRYRQPVQQMQRSQQQQRQQQAEQQRVWQQHRANRWDSEHRSWQQRGGYSGYRIPDNYFRSHYGRGHWFRIYNLPFMFVSGYPRFQYNGYWFDFMDPYPEYWGPNWYQTDDVYVDYYNDGYYLYNRRYPGRPGIAISIAF
jgi:flagellar motor protein MotB